MKSIHFSSDLRWLSRDLFKSFRFEDLEPGNCLQRILSIQISRSRLLLNCKIFKKFASLGIWKRRECCFDRGDWESVFIKIENHRNHCETVQKISHQHHRVIFTTDNNCDQKVWFIKAKSTNYIPSEKISKNFQSWLYGSLLKYLWYFLLGRTRRAIKLWWCLKLKWINRNV